MPRHERRLIEPEYPRAASVRTPAHTIVHNFRVVRSWTQEIAAEWWGVSARTWQRYEVPGAYVPPPLLKRIKTWALRSCPERIDYLS